MKVHITEFKLTILDLMGMLVNRVSLWHKCSINAWWDALLKTIWASWWLNYPTNVHREVQIMIS